MTRDDHEAFEALAAAVAQLNAAFERLSQRVYLNQSDSETGRLAARETFLTIEEKLHSVFAAADRARARGDDPCCPHCGRSG